MSEARTIIGEHVALHQLRDALRREVAAVSLDAEPWRARVAARLTELRTHLESHFGREERAGLFDHLGEHTPEHIPAAARLRQEHDVLREALARLLREAGNHEVSAHVLGERVRSFLDDLVSHEERENDLLVSRLDDSVAAAD